jgi:hypothetical protein
VALTYYEVLGVPENATDSEIESAFRSKAREVHPDKVAPGSPYLRKVASEAFKDLSEAKTVLLNRVERQKYDAELAYFRGSTGTSATPPPAPQAAPPPKRPPQSPPQPPPSPPPSPQPAQKYSFWKPTNTKFGTTVPVAGGLGCILFLVGITTDARCVLPGLTLVLLALALLSWRHGMRPGTDPKVLGGSVFLFIFAAICFSGWIESLPPNSKQAIPNPGQPTIASAVPLTSPDTVPCKTVNITACVGTPAPKQSLKSAPTTKGPQPSNAHHPAKNAPVVTTTNDPATGRTIFSNGTSAVSSEPLPSPKPTATLVNKTWRNLRDGQTYRTRLDGETLYLESTESYPKRTSDIANCKFHRAISVGLSWVGECWERNPKDQSIYKSDATVTTFSEARIEIGTGDKTPFAMIPAENAPSSFSQNSVAVGTQVVSPAPSSAPLSPERALAPSRAMASPQSDVSSLSVPERQSIEAACATAKYNQGPAAYNQCLQAQLSELRAGPRRPDLSDLSVPERQSIEAVCATAKYNQGPAAYNRCLRTQLELLKKSR